MRQIDGQMTLCDDTGEGSCGHDDTGQQYNWSSVFNECGPAGYTVEGA